MEKTYNRITSIDALRAFALFGILFIHVNNNSYCDVSPLKTTLVDYHVSHFISTYIVNRCNLIFRILFGVSFYLILRKPTANVKKFAWRCFLLCMFGLLNTFFYWGDVLFVYGLFGIGLIPLRRMSNRSLFLIALFFFGLTYATKTFVSGSLLIPENGGFHRYTLCMSIAEIIKCYPYSLLHRYNSIVSTGIFYTFPYFIIGYMIGKMGIIENLQSFLTKKKVLVICIFYVIIFVIRKYSELWFIKESCNLMGSLAYASLFIWLYYNTIFQSLGKYCEPYGKCGLTNYSMQGMFGVVVMTDLGLINHFSSYSILLLFFLSFFIAQTIFSYYWIKHFLYGPFEWLWRCGTELRWIPVVRNSNNKQNLKA